MKHDILINSEVRYDKELRPNAKLIYGEIKYLCDINGFCTASNEFFSNLYSLKKDTVSRLISQLVNKKYIKLQFLNENGRQFRFIHITNPKIFYGGND
jgi:hypothetical protein